MGREIRRVLPHWEHPKRTCPHLPPCAGYRCYQPLYDKSYDKAAKEWIKDFKKFKPKKDAKYYWDWNGMPPDREYYRPDWNVKEATWLQVYETVSEGTPVTPAFASPDKLVEYLCTHGDYWDQRRGDGPWTRANAEQFVKDEWAPSGMVVVGKGFFGSKDTPTLDRAETTSEDSSV